jgi:hypothetical protein
MALILLKNQAMESGLSRAERWSEKLFTEKIE